MFPDLPALGPIHLHTYGILLALGFWLGSGLLWREARRQGWDENSVATLSLLLLLVSVIGARGFFVVTTWGTMRTIPSAP